MFGTSQQTYPSYVAETKSILDSLILNKTVTPQIYLHSF